jgi:hypothetical protein
VAAKIEIGFITCGYKILILFLIAPSEFIFNTPSKLPP